MTQYLRKFVANHWSKIVIVVLISLIALFPTGKIGTLSVIVYGLYIHSLTLAVVFCLVSNEALEKLLENKEAIMNWGKNFKSLSAPVIMIFAIWVLTYRRHGYLLVVTTISCALMAVILVKIKRETQRRLIDNDNQTTS